MAVGDVSNTGLDYIHSFLKLLLSEKNNSPGQILKIQPMSTIELRHE